MRLLRRKRPGKLPAAAAVEALDLLIGFLRRYLTPLQAVHDARDLRLTLRAAGAKDVAWQGTFSIG